MRNSRGIVSISVITLLAFATLNCAPVEIKKNAIQKEAIYKFTLQQNGIRISVNPYIEENRLQEFSGYDLLSKGVLPVWVVIENQNAEDGYFLLKEKTNLIVKSPEAPGSEYARGEMANESPTMNSSTTDVFNSLSSGASVAPLFGVVGVAYVLALFPFAISSFKSSKDEITISRIIEEKQMPNKTIYRGGIQSGFLYFKLGKKEDVSKIQGINFNMRNLRSSEIVSITVNMGNP
jgi:hypothetical protein